MTASATPENYTTLTDVTPPYADYQLKTEREIPVVVLDPVH